MYENIDKTKYTPMIRQYLEIKEQYPDMLVFFRLGDFYELFFNDAVVASKELEIVLTSKDAGVTNDKVPMCGVPHHAVDNYIEKLSEKGYKIVIVEQLEEAGINKIVHREVTRIITPGTNIDQSYLSEKTSNYIGCLDSFKDNYYLSYIEMSTGESFITSVPSQIDLVYSEISKLNIKELVISANLSKSIQNHLSKVCNVLLSINEDLTIDSYLESIVSNLDEHACVCSKRLLSYIVTTQKRVLVHIKPFKFYDNKEYLKINSKTVKNLELVESLSGNRFKNNLFSVLDKCSTAMGSRFLKKSMLFPLVNVKKINERLDLISEFMKHYNQTLEIKKALCEVYDLERIIGRISFGSPSPRDILQLKKSLGIIPYVKQILRKIKSPIVLKLEENLCEFSTLYQELDSSIREDAPYLTKDGAIIKDGYSKELDDIKNVESTNKDFLVNLEAKEREKTGIKSLRVGYNRVFGYYIEITNSYLSQVKDEFGYIRKQTTSNSERFITQELKEREALILRSSELALKLELELFAKIKELVRSSTQELQTLATSISYLDMLISLSVVAKEKNYCRPEFTMYDEMKIVDGRHPVIEEYASEPFIPNDLILYNNEKILLITGPNMSGKSTYMRQNALISIMAQMGSFVPSTSAILPLYDAIFTRIGSSDDITSGESTFMSEMLEVNYALKNATSKSLIIFDEVGRGTATYDGMALAQAIIEYIHNDIGAKTFFSTHYHELTSLEESLPYLRNVHVEANASNFTTSGEIVFLHKVMDGATDKSYGINVANLAKIPLKVTLRAKDILEKLVNNQNYDKELLSPDNYVEPVIISTLDKDEEEVLKELKETDVNKVSPMDALLLISKWKELVDK